MLRRFDVETTSKAPRGGLIDDLSILKIESTSKILRQIDVIISTWVRLLNLCHFDELSKWNFDIESIANQPGCVHWEATC